MRTIHKFPIDPSIDSITEIKTTVGYRILTAQVQGGRPYVWVEMDLDDLPVITTVTVIGTGRMMPENAAARLWYVGTFQMQDGTYVGHVYHRVP